MELGVWDQLPCLTAYTQMLLGFPLDENNEELVDTATQALESACFKLTKAFPFLVGKVVNERPHGDEETSSGINRVVPYEPHNGKTPVLHVKDCREICHSFDEIVKAKAAINMLPESILAPKNGLPNSYLGEEDTPVLIIQANIIKGGLILCFTYHHNAGDMNALGHIIKLFAAAMRSDAFSSADLAAGDLSTRQQIPGLLPGEQALDHADFRCPSSLSGSTGSEPFGSAAPAPWKQYHFSASALFILKQSTTHSNPHPSTNDFLSAFIWQRILFARSLTLPSTTSRLIRAINGRRHLPSPLNTHYLGHNVAIAVTRLPLSTLLSSTPPPAAALRATILSCDAHYFRSLTSTLTAATDKTTFSYGACMEPATDVLLSSWTDLGVCECGFGNVLGRAWFVNRPCGSDVEGLVYLLPRSVEGGVDVIMSLSREDARRLGEERVWRGVVVEIC